ncbi:hypothetical protein [uncultured Draconibacterium sp.]|uniref:hypothetical protein n=1 Tax=uncultured Draconibacterium sp. TaxID=1573823 RepID=UPI0032165376
MKPKQLIFLILVLILFSCTQQSKPPTYLGQNIPFEHPEIFAKGMVSVDSTSESMISVTNDGFAIFFMRYFKDEKGNTNGVQSLYTRFDGKKWTDLKQKDREMFYRTPRFVNDSLAIMESNACIWKSKKVNDSTWTKPVFVDSLDLSRQNGVSDWSITADLTLFYVQNGDIVTSRIENDQLDESKKIAGFEGFKTRHVGVAPAGDYLICDGFLEGVNNGWVDNFISFRKTDASWTFPVHMDSTINTKGEGNYFPRISPDGAVFFFSRQNSANLSDILWLSTKGLDSYKNLAE